MVGGVRERSAKEMTKIFLALLIFMAIFIFVLTATLIYYSPVVDRLVNFCDKYPNSLEDCKE